MISNENFQIALIFLKLAWFGNKIFILCIKVGFKEILHLRSRAILRFLLPPLILRLYSRYRFDQTISSCLAIFQRLKVLHVIYKGYNYFFQFQKIKVFSLRMPTKVDSSLSANAH